MLLDPAETQILGHAGWGESDKWLWRYDIETGREERLAHFPSGFKMWPSRDGKHVLIGDRPEPHQQRFSIATLSDPMKTLSVAVHERGWTFEGDEALWKTVPRFALVWADDETQLLHIDASDPDPHPLDWYSNDAYDLGYQGLLDAYEVPGSNLVIIAVQRDSRPVVYDRTSRNVVGHVPLANRGGNPKLYFRRLADELWADDYDTLLRVRPVTWEAISATTLQRPEGAMRQFIGTFWFPWDERVCLVPRPFSGDVVMIDPSSFATIGSVVTGQQPLEAVVLRDETIIARDWHSRDIIRVEGGR